MSLTIDTDEKRSERQLPEDGRNVDWNDVLYVYIHIYI